jgi:hypothetical protein
VNNEISNHDMIDVWNAVLPPHPTPPNREMVGVIERLLVK